MGRHWIACPVVVGGFKFILIQMTLKEFVAGRPTLEVLDIFAKADKVLASKGGRYCGGQLSDADIEALTPVKPKPRGES